MAAGCVGPSATADVDASNGPAPGSDGSNAPAVVIDVPLVGIFGYEYTAPVVIGGVTFQAQADTGSTPLGIAAAACGSQCSGVSPLYTPGATAEDLHATYGGTYADMSGWNAEAYRDEVAVGTSAAVSVDFGAITSQTMFFSPGDALQGILGLGPDDLIAPPLSSWKTQLFAAGVAPEMAFRLCETHGDMWLGGYDPTAMVAAPVFTPMAPMTTAQPFYAVDVAGLQVGTTAIAADFGPTLVDTGTAFTYVPTSIASALLTAVIHSAGYAATFGKQQLSATSCVTTSSTRAEIDAALPAMSIQFPDGQGGMSAPIELAPTRSYLYDNGNGTWCLDVLDNSGFGLTIMGDTMQESFVTVFDLANQRIGFAAETGCGTEELVRDRAPFPAAATGLPWFSSNPWFHELRRR